MHWHITCHLLRIKINQSRIEAELFKQLLCNNKKVPSHFEFRSRLDPKCTTEKIIQRINSRAQQTWRGWRKLYGQHSNTRFFFRTVYSQDWQFGVILLGWCNTLVSVRDSYVHNALDTLSKKESSADNSLPTFMQSWSTFHLFEVPQMEHGTEVDIWYSCVNPNLMGKLAIQVAPTLSYTR